MMRAARFYGPGIFKVEEVEIPDIGPGDILVENRVTLTCGTDVKMYKRGHPFAKPPLIIGHEFAGVVAAVGEGVDRFAKGMRVVAANSAPCNECYFCMKGRENLCERLDESIIGFAHQGAYAQYVRIPEHIVRQNTHMIPDDIPFEHAAFLEPLSCVVHGIELINIQPGDTVVVMGAGPIGLLHMQLAKHLGAKQLVVTDVYKPRLDHAVTLGADHVINNKDEDQISRVRVLTAGRGADVVIEAVGRPETWELAIQSTRAGGTTLLFGGCAPGTKASLDTQKLHYGELTIKGSFHHTPRTVERAFGLISSGTLRLDPLITSRMGLTDVERALQLVSQGDALKVALDPRS